LSIGDIVPRSPTDRLRRGDLSNKELATEFDADLVAAVVGMSRAFIARALDRPKTRPKTFSLAEVLQLLDVDGFQETFVPRSKIPHYLLHQSHLAPSEIPALRRSVRTVGDVELHVGDARSLLPNIEPGSIQCAVTSSPYWGMRKYENERSVHWADGDFCPYGFEQTPEAFIRHSVEILHLMKPAIASSGSVWWNIMDTYNTRTPIRQTAKERLEAMGQAPGTRAGWTSHQACRHSAGHMYLADAELSSIPPRIAERASRIGYKLKSYITWRKHASTPEPTKSRVSRQAEYVLHLSIEAAPYFDKASWQALQPYLGGPSDRESRAKITDVWSIPTSTGRHHGAEFPLALAGRCIALTSRPGDLVLDPFVGSGTTALAAQALHRRCVGYDISESYIQIAEQRLRAAVADTQPSLDISASAETEPLTLVRDESARQTA
jgi:DNA modification methylase